MEVVDGAFELAVDARCTLGEGPVWDVRSGRLLWVDIEGRGIHWFRPGDGVSGRWRVEQRTGAVWPRAAGGLVAADELGFAWLELPEGADGGTGPLVRHGIADLLADDPALRMNDGAVDPAGRFWAGTIRGGGEPDRAALYRLDPDLRVTTALDPVTVSNGIDWSPDGTTMYYTDTPTQRIDAFAYDVATGTATARRTFAVIDDADGFPDGLIVDAEGGVWLALWGTGEVRRYGPDGAITHRLRLPTDLASKPAFGGPDLGDLYVTSARTALVPPALARQPIAGGLFVTRPGPVGRSPTPFGG